MSVWAIGDLQGCYDVTQRLLEKLRFDPAVDRLSSSRTKRSTTRPRWSGGTPGPVSATTRWISVASAGMDPGARLRLGQRGVPEVYSGSRSRGKRMGQSGTVRL